MACRESCVTGETARRGRRPAGRRVACRGAGASRGFAPRFPRPLSSVRLDGGHRASRMDRLGLARRDRALGPARGRGRRILRLSRRGFRRRQRRRRVPRREDHLSHHSLPWPRLAAAPGSRGSPRRRRRRIRDLRPHHGHAAARKHVRWTRSFLWFPLPFPEILSRRRGMLPRKSPSVEREPAQRGEPDDWFPGGRGARGISRAKPERGTSRTHSHRIMEVTSCPKHDS